MAPSNAALGHDKKQRIFGIIGVGCSLRTAAEFVGVPVETIRREAERDPELAKQLRRAEHQPEIANVQRIQHAASQERYWRAAAWALERRNPEDFAARRPDVMTPGELRPLLTQIAEAIAEEVDNEAARRKLLEKLAKLIAEYAPS